MVKHFAPSPRRGTGRTFEGDHILIKAKCSNSARNCRSYSSLELDSVARIEVSLRCSKIKSNNGRQTTRLGESIRESSSLQNKYAVAVENQFTILKEVRSIIIVDTANNRKNWRVLVVDCGSCEQTLVSE